MLERVGYADPADHYVRLHANDYSVHPAVVGRRVEVAADLEHVKVISEHRLVAEHARCWAKHQSITDPVHAEAAAALRRERMSLARPPADTEVEQRSLTDYDRILGLGGEVA